MGVGNIYKFSINGKGNLLIFGLVLIGLVVIFSYGMNSVSAASGSTIYVNSSSGNDAFNGSTWLLAKKSIKNATKTVNSGGTVKIANGKYTGDNNNLITIDKDMIIQGQSKTGTIINGSGTNWIFTINNGITVTIKNLELTNGKTDNVGGAIYNNGNLTVIDSNFIKNNAPAGGAIFNDVGNLIVNDCTFTNNNATQSGGAIFNINNLNIINSNFTNNFATAYSGAVHNQNILTVNNCNFIGNTAGNGAALTNTGFGTMTVKSCTFTGNNANANSIITNYGTASVNFNRIANNANSVAIGNGGSINGEFNWWGDNNGPAGKILGFTVNKWMVLKLNAVPSTIQSNSYSKLTADLRYDNIGNIHTSTYLPNGIPIIFKTTLGTFSSTTTTINGFAQTILRSVTLGTANVAAKLDNQTMQTTVKIIDTIPPKVTSTTPKNNLNNVPKTVVITIKFSENFKASTNFNSIVIKNLSTNKNLILSRSISGNTLTIKTSAKNANTTYQVIIPKSAIKDNSGNNLAATYTFKFKTGS